MAAGFSHGYFGIQELGDGRKVAIFSAWDPDHGDKDSADQRVQTIFAADDVRVKRFGGEGTGGQCMFDFDWAIGQTYRFMIKSAVTEDNTTNVKRTQYARARFSRRRRLRGSNLGYIQHDHPRRQLTGALLVCGEILPPTTEEGRGNPPGDARKRPGSENA